MENAHKYLAGMIADEEQVVEECQDRREKDEHETVVTFLEDILGSTRGDVEINDKTKHRVVRIVNDLSDKPEELTLFNAMKIGLWLSVIGDKEKQ